MSAIQRYPVVFAVVVLSLLALPASALAALTPAPASYDWGNVNRYGTSPSQTFTRHALSCFVECNIDPVVVDSLKALDPEWPIREADDSPRLRFGQFADLTCRLHSRPRRPHEVNSSSKALASFRSSVSKPSVNQP